MKKPDEFPAGLEQPGGSARFSQDALLLAAFAVKSLPEKIRRRSFMAIEAGSGCGAALLGLALLAPLAKCAGFDSESILTEAANLNAARLFLAERCQFLTADSARPERDLTAWRETADVFICNPPWRDEQKGIATKNPMRKKAHWQNKNTLSVFLRAAEFCMRRHAMLCLILPVARLPDLFRSLNATTLGLRALLPVASFADAPAKRLLCLCKKGAASDFTLHAPLAIHQRAHDKTIYSSAAQDFCPWLKNPAGYEHTPAVFSPVCPEERKK